MMPEDGYPSVDTFLTYLAREAPMCAKHVQETAARHPVLFNELAERMLTWARQVLGEGWCETVADGYLMFVTDANRSQADYERSGRYRFSSYDEVFAQTYDDPEFMTHYHWGAYAITFAWEHHLLLYDFFLRHFLTPLRETGPTGRLLDLGCGSGIWSTLALSQLEGWHATMVDISATSVGLTRRTLTCAGLDRRTDLRQSDALRFRGDAPFDAGISCFLLEHLETPQQLLDNLSASLGARRLAFVTTALTAGEIDHIFEFRRESEVVALAEQAVFRVVASFSSAPRVTPARVVFTPRSMALVLQKRAGQYW
jgi:2-polyprenyl-3-methyl-5-hydroxy-6-metoxy-1,4-benzoquinol methylase